MISKREKSRKGIHTFAPSLPRSANSRPLKNRMLVPCLPIPGHRLRRKRERRDQCSFLSSLIRVRSTSRDEPRKSWPMMMSGSALYNAALKKVSNDSSYSRKKERTEDTVQQCSFVRTRSDWRPPLRLPCLFLKTRWVCHEWSDKGVHGCTEFLRRCRVFDVHWGNVLAPDSEEARRTHCFPILSPTYKQPPVCFHGD